MNAKLILFAFLGIINEIPGSRTDVLSKNKIQIMGNETENSSDSSLNLLKQKVISAYGGSHVWRNYKYIEAEVSDHGLAFRLKGRNKFDHVKLKMEIHRPWCSISPINKNPDITGVLDGETVRLVNTKGDTLSERKNARSYFPGGRRFFKWDDLDMCYFANYAFWNYFTLPNLLSNEKIKWTSPKDGMLIAEFPNDIPTHCKKQEFIFDSQTGLLKQHNYTVDIFGQWAKAANVVYRHQQVDTIPYPSFRIVTPRKKNGKARKGPQLIVIDVHQLKFTN